MNSSESDFPISETSDIWYQFLMTYFRSHAAKFVQICTIYRSQMVIEVAVRVYV